MPSIVTQAIVLRHADYREHDRMLTLLSPSMGRIEAVCRGCKRPQSPLLAASEWFALGEYVLYAGKGRMNVSSCNVTESFFPLRTDYERLKYATYILSVAEAAAQPGEKRWSCSRCWPGLCPVWLTRTRIPRRSPLRSFCISLPSVATGPGCPTASTAAGAWRTRKSA